MSQTQGHETIGQLLAERSAGGGLRLLDIPSGDGPVQDSARASGYEVIGLDLFPSEGFRGVQGDACAPLPFK